MPIISSTRSQTAQVWLKLPCRVTAFFTSGSIEKFIGWGPQPTFVMWPAGRIQSSADFSETDAPVESMITSAPRPSPRPARTFIISWVMTSTAWVAPACRPIAMRPASRVVPARITCPAPDSFAMVAQSRPMGPGPMTITVSPGRMWAFTTVAWYATQQGSVIAATSIGTFFGIRWRSRAGTLTYSAIAPWMS